MTSNDGQRLRVFGLSFREHDNRKMQQILRHYNQLPQNPGHRESLFVQLTKLGQRMNTDDNAQDDIQKLTIWLKNGSDFPFRIAPPPRHQQAHHGAQRTPHRNLPPHFNPYNSNFQSHGHHLDAAEDYEMNANENEIADAPAGPSSTQNPNGTQPAHVRRSHGTNYDYNWAFQSRGRRLDTEAGEEADEIANPPANAIPNGQATRNIPMPFYQAPAGMQFPQLNHPSNVTAPAFPTPSHPGRQVVETPVNAINVNNNDEVNIEDVVEHQQERAVRADGGEWEPPEGRIPEFEGHRVHPSLARDIPSYREIDDEIVYRPGTSTQSFNDEDSQTGIPDDHFTEEGDLECPVCLETYPRSQFPRDRITDSCVHTDLACLPCLNYSIEITLARGALNELACPNCPEKLSHRNVNDYATPENFTRYEYLKMRSSMPSTFIMCLAPGCGCGQEHEGGEGEPMMICQHCKFKTCVKHKLPWHEGQTCEQFELDEKQLNRLEEEEASAKLLASMQARICPNCSQGVEKEAGCNHMRCRCGQEWCYICMCSWENILRIGPTAHAPTCTSHPNKVNLRRDQQIAQQQRMMRLLHGGEVSDTLAKARDELRKKRREMMRPLAAAAAELRMKQAQEITKTSNKDGSQAEAPRKKKIKLLPAWEEGGRTVV